MDELRLQRIDMKIAFTQILALIACALLTACGAGNSCIGHNGCSDTAATTTTTTTTTPTTTTTTVVSGVVSILAGASAFHSFADGTGTAAKFNSPEGLVVDSSGNVYVADRGNNRIRKITSAGVVTTFAGSATAGTANGTGTAATFNQPNAITIDSSGNLYVIDAFAATQIRKITPAGVVTSFAGQVGVTGSTDGTGTTARFGGIQGIAIDSSDNLYVTDTSNFKIRKITSAGVVTTFAGSGTTGTVNATGTAASFQDINRITVDSSGNLYVTESGGGQTIRKITPAGVVTTFAGLKDTGGEDVNGTLTAARFSQPYGIAIDSSNNLYISEFQFGFQNNIRKIVFTTTTTTTTTP